MWPRDWSSDVCSSDLVLIDETTILSEGIRNLFSDLPPVEDVDPLCRNARHRMGKALILEDIPDLVRCVILFKVDLIRVFVRLDPIYRAIPHRLIILGNTDTLLQILNRRCKSQIGRAHV